MPFKHEWEMNSVKHLPRHYKAAIIETVSYWHKDRQISGTDNLEIDLYMYRYT